MRFAENLEAVTNTEDKTTTVGKINDRFHDWAETRYGAGADVVTVAEPSGNDDAVIGREIVQGMLVLVPKLDRFTAQNGTEHVHHVIITVAAGEEDYAEFHRRMELVRRKGNSRRGNVGADPAILAGQVTCRGKFLARNRTAYFWIDIK